MWRPERRQFLPGVPRPVHFTSDTHYTDQGATASVTMLIKTTYHDVPSKLDPNGNKIRIFVISPNIPSYPRAKFPGN